MRCGWLLHAVLQESVEIAEQMFLQQLVIS
jgi:hypothetical protein